MASIITTGTKALVLLPPAHVRIHRVLGETVTGSVCGAAALMAYAVRAPSSSLLAPSVYRGCSRNKTVSLTFDDGPSEQTPEILTILSKYQIHATFFQCGANIRRLPGIAQTVAADGHEIGNHSDTHPNLCFHSSRSIASQFSRAQVVIEDVIGRSPSLLRAPFGVRWFGLREVQRKLNLMGVMWTVIGNDWKLDAPSIAARLLKGAENGAIFCLHDGRELRPCPKTSATAEALRIAIPQFLDRGYRFETVHRILCPKN